MILKNKVQEIISQKNKELKQLQNMLSSLEDTELNKQIIEQLKISISLQEESISKLKKI